MHLPLYDAWEGCRERPYDLIDCSIYINEIQRFEHLLYSIETVIVQFTLTIFIEYNYSEAFEL